MFKRYLGFLGDLMPSRGPGKTGIILERRTVSALAREAEKSFRER